MNFKLRKNINHSKTISYEILVTDWSIDVEFNHYASMCAWESDREFEESVSITLNGHLVDTRSKERKKLAVGLVTSIRIYGNDAIYDSRGEYSIDEDDRSIGKLVYQRFFETEKKAIS